VGAAAPTAVAVVEVAAVEVAVAAALAERQPRPGRKPETAAQRSR